MKESVNELFQKQVLKTPDNIAIIDEINKITYKGLNEKANKFANYLRKKGVKKNDRICLIMEHKIEIIISLFAIIKCGATYIPIEPSFPIKRIDFIINEAKPKFVITEEKYKDTFDTIYKNIFYNEKEYDYESNLNIESIDDNKTPLYILYTSGTTGVPKGVVVTHQNVYNYINAFKKFFRITEKDIMLQSSVCTFDIFVEEVFPILMTGGTLVVANSKQIGNSIELFNLIKKHKVTITSTFPYFLNDVDKYIKDVTELPNSWKIAISGGDTLRKEYIGKISNKLRVFNTYGPTETTVCASYYEFKKDYIISESIPIGKPIENVEIYILDDNLKKVKDGEFGEICISGKGVSNGYLNQIEKTNKNFIINPFNVKEKLYKTGDIGRKLSDGNYDFLKRKDQQVMIYGKRVEPLEVEKVMLKNEHIKNAIVKPFIDSNGYSYLTAYYTLNNDVSDDNIEKIKDGMHEYLPDFMIPEFFVKMNEFPIGLNGKINLKDFPLIMK